MKLDALPSPGLIPSAMSLRAAAIKAISYVEVMADLKGGKTEQATTLDNFLVACRNSLSAYKDGTAPTLISGLLDRSENDNLITLTFSEPLDPTVVPALSAFAVTLGGSPLTESAISIVGDKVLLTVTENVTAGSLQVAYTQPGVNGLRDLSGNLVATFAATAITNQA